MLFHKIKFLFILISLIPSMSLLASDVADDGRWKQDRYYHGFKIFTRDEEGTDILGIKAEGILDASIIDLMANLRDVEGSTDWTPNQVSKITIENKSDIEAVTASLTDMPWPLKNRSLILNNKLVLDEKRKLLFVLSHSVTHPKTPEFKDSILASVRYSNIGFRPISKNKTYAEMTVFVNPNGSIPKFLINFYQKKFPVKFLKELERRATTHKMVLLPGIKEMFLKLLSIINMPETIFYPTATAKSGGRSKEIATK